MTATTTTTTTSNDMSIFSSSVHQDYDPCCYEHEEESNKIELQLHIVWSTTYDCPTLYFNAYYQSAPIVNLDHLQSLGIINTLDTMQTATSGLLHVSQTDHPVLHVPFFHLHPCNTRHVLNELTEEKESLGRDVFTDRQFVAWLTSLQPLFPSSNIQLLSPSTAAKILATSSSL